MSDLVLVLDPVSMLPSNCFRCYRFGAVVGLISDPSILHRMLWVVVHVDFGLDLPLNISIVVWTRCLIAFRLEAFSFLFNPHRSTSQCPSFDAPMLSASSINPHCCYWCCLVDCLFNSIDATRLVSCWWGTSYFLFFYRLVHCHLFFRQCNLPFFSLSLSSSYPHCSWCSCSCRPCLSMSTLIFLHCGSCRCWHARRVLVSCSLWYKTHAVPLLRPLLLSKSSTQHASIDAAVDTPAISLPLLACQSRLSVVACCLM